MEDWGLVCRNLEVVRMICSVRTEASRLEENEEKWDMNMLSLKLEWALNMDLWRGRGKRPTLA